MNDKNVVVIQTPISSKSFTQVTCLMSDEELKQAKAERPDLVFRLLQNLPVEDTVVEPQSLPDDETKGITVRGMTLPHDLEYLINEVLAKE